MIAVGQDPDVLAGLEALETDRALALNEGQGGVERERVSEKKKKKQAPLGSDLAYKMDSPSSPQRT